MRIIKKIIKKYQKYKPSGIHWLGDIPEHWDVRRLKYISNIVMGQSPDSKDYTLNSDGLPFLQGNADFKQKFPQARIFCNTANKKATINSLLLSVRAPVGALNIADKVYGIGRGLCSIQTISNYLNLNYLWYAMPTHSTYLFIHSTGSTYDAVSIADVSNTPINIPPLQEQIQIASFLDWKVGQINKFIKIKKRILELLKEQKQVIINDVVTGKIDVRTGKPYPKYKASGVEWLGDIPEEWEVKKITHIFSTIGSGTTPDSGNLKYYSGNIPWLLTGDLNDGYLFKTKKFVSEEALNKFSALKVYPKNSLVVAMYGATIGKVSLLDFSFTSNQACCVFAQPNENNIPNFHLYQFLYLKKFIVRLSYGGGQPNISQDLLKSLRVISPPLQGQILISRYLDEKTEAIDRAIIRIEREIELIKEYKERLIADVVTGKLDIRGVEVPEVIEDIEEELPEDEPEEIEGIENIEEVE